MPITWHGAPQVAAKAKDGMLEACEVLLAHAVDQTPWVEHHLRNSGTTDVASQGETVTGVVSFNTPYARIQHEALDFHHPNGGNAKFLERPANQFGDELLQIIGANLREVFQ